MKTFIILLLSLSIFPLFPLFQTRAHAESQYEAGTETETQIIEEEKDGKKTKKITRGKKKSHSEREVGKVSEEEASELETRRRSLKLWSLGIGPFWSSTLKSDALMYGGEIGRHWDVHEHAELRIIGTTAFSEKVNFVSAALGGSFFPLTQDFTPLIGADFGGGWIFGSDIQNSAGFSIDGVAGLRFFRTSDTQLDVSFRYLTILGKKSGTPNVYGLTLSILFN